MTSLTKNLRETIHHWPTKPGVYLIRDEQEKIIYIGKAKNLRTRIRSYLNPMKKGEGVSNSFLSPKTKHLINKISHIECLRTDTEVEAFLLEASLIKKHKPKYNIRLKDDKSYPYLSLSVKKAFPRFSITRKVKNDDSLYFGPYTQGTALRETMDFLNKTFKIRDCSDHFMKQRKRPCLTYQMGFCEAPCVRWITKADYSKNVKAALNFLKGKSSRLKENLKKQMQQAAKEEKFELATQLRNSLQSLEILSKRDSRIQLKKSVDQDVITWLGDRCFGFLIEIFHFRKASTMGKSSHFLSPPQAFLAEDTKKELSFFSLFSSETSSSPKNSTFSSDEWTASEWITSFLSQYYSDHLIPEKILFSKDLKEKHIHILEISLKKRFSNFTPLLLFPSFNPDKEDKKICKILDLEIQKSFEKLKNKKESLFKALKEIQVSFSLPFFPRRIEGFDVSHFQSDPVASQVVFEDGEAKKSDYRHYKIKSPKTKKGSPCLDDFAYLKEILKRRFQRKEGEFPQLILIDGGKGQLNKALEILKEENLEEKIFAVGIAKARTQRNFQSSKIQSSKERFYLPNTKMPFYFPKNSEALRILVSLRDEAHRFALRLQKKQREKKIPKNH